MAIGLLASAACSGDDGGGDNVLSTTAGTDTDASTTTAGTGGADTGVVGNMFPETFRFSCIDIQLIGDNPDSFQANTLEQQWQQDMDVFKLNILADILERDDAAGTSVMQIRSGVGGSATDMCSDGATESVEHAAGYDTALNGWGPVAAGTEDLCSSASDEPMGGSYVLSTAATDVFHIYAEDNDGTTFNCTSDPNVLDAVPLHAIEATFTQNVDGTKAWGTLSGCLVETEAEALCSCLGQCAGAANADCAGCPDGSVPLRTLLGTIQPDQACSDTMGVPAFTMTLGFSADLLPAVPGTCG
jgi:hypothetical protein